MLDYLTKTPIINLKVVYKNTVYTQFQGAQTSERGLVERWRIQ